MSEPQFLTLDPRTSPLHLPSHLSPDSPNNSDSDYTDSISPLTPSPVGHHEPYRLSGFPAFNFNLPVTPATPTAPTAALSPPHPTTSTASLIPTPPIPPRASPPPQITTPIPAPVPEPVQSNAAPGGVHRPLSTDPAPPPPYERYNNRIAPPAINIPNRGGRSAAATNAPRRFSGQRHMYPLALRGGGGGGDVPRSGPAQPANWRIIGADDKPESVEGEQRQRISRRGKWIIALVAFIVLVSVVVVGVVFGTMRAGGGNRRGSAAGNGTAGALIDFDPADFPALPMGVVVLNTPDEPVVPAEACVRPATLWSCHLPRDSKFPSNTTGKPEFVFTIALRNSSNDVAGAWDPVPAVVAEDDEYEAVAREDGINGTPMGEKTAYYVSMQTEENSPINIASSSSNSLSVSSISGAGNNNSSNSNSTSSNSPEKRQAPTSETANMLPSLLRNQQLRLFDRGLETEHYAFFVHFKKTINVLAVTDDAVTELTNRSDTPAGVAAGVSAKQVVWENTRFRVVIWTKMRTGRERDLLGNNGERVNSVEDWGYVVSVFEDRKGAKGGVYWMEEGKVGRTSVVEENVEGGCSCEWRNWRVASGSGGAV